MKIQVNNKKIKERILSTILVLTIGFLFILTIKPANAVTPSMGFFAGGFNAVGASSCPISNAIGSQTGVTFVLTVTTEPSDNSKAPPTLLSITDSLGLTWQSAALQGVPGITQNGGTLLRTTDAVNVEVWYAQSTGTVSGTQTLTLTYSPAWAANGCLWELDDINGIYFPINTQGATFSTTTAPPSTFTFQPSLSYTNPSGTIIMGVAGMFGTYTTAGTRFNTANTPSGFTELTANPTTSVDTPTSTGASGPYCNTGGNNAAICFNMMETAWIYQSTTGNNLYSFNEGWTGAGTSFAWAWNIELITWSSSPSFTTGTQTQTIGSCPTKNTNTFTMVNNTIYLYTGNSLGQEVVNTVSTSVSSTIGSGSHTLQLLIYASSSSTVSVTTPLNLLYSKSFTLTSGTVKNIITAQVGILINNPSFPFQAGNVWAVGIVGDNKINLNQSSLSGLTTLTGNPSTATQPNTFTNIGTSVTTKLYLCAIASYQTFITTTSISTSTVAGTTTSTVTSTFAQLASPQGGANILLDLLTYLPIWILPLIFAKMLGTTGLLYGLMISLLLGIFLGLFPYWTIFILILMIYFLLR